MAKNRYATRRTEAGYLTPAQREGCRSCRHRGAEALQFDIAPAYYCTAHGFYVSPGGICKHYQLAGVAGVPVTHQGGTHA